MIVELVNTGSELMLGRVLNSHQQWLCRQLADLGYLVARQVAVADQAGEIARAVGESLSRADLVITTGGLGPTSDDLTRACIAALLGRPLREDAVVREQIRDFFTQRNRPMPEGTRAEALVPEGALVLPNCNGTAPGLAVELAPNRFRNGGKTSWLIMLPGPTRELRPMFLDQVVPLIKNALPLNEPFVCRTLRTTGLGESFVQEKIHDLLSPLVHRGVGVGYCARPGQVDVRLSAQGLNAENLVGEAEAVVRAQLGSGIFAHDEAEIEAVVVRLLTERKQTLAAAESCTGGCVAHRLTSVPGASAVFLGSLVTYSNETKQRLLGVNSDTLERHGAVSEAVAREMADGARRVCGSDYAIAVTGIAGPSGGTPDKPVGTVFLALASPVGTEAWRQSNPWDRLTFKEVTAQQALNHLRLLLERS